MKKFSCLGADHLLRVQGHAESLLNHLSETEPRHLSIHPGQTTPKLSSWATTLWIVHVLQIQMLELHFDALFTPVSLCTSHITFCGRHAVFVKFSEFRQQSFFFSFFCLCCYCRFQRASVVMLIERFVSTCWSNVRRGKGQRLTWRHIHSSLSI